MRLRQRVREVERMVGIGDDVTVHIVWDGRGEEIWRPRVEEARRRGWRINLIQVRVQDFADTVEEAEAALRRLRDRDDRVPITIYRKERGSDEREVLARWDPGLPEWLREDDPEV